LEERIIGQTTLQLVTGDITKQHTDAIVNAANKRLAPGGGVAGAIHRAAGPGLWAECQRLGGCRTGEAKLTAGHALPAKYVLRACYRNSLTLADDTGITSIAFPAISTGAFGYPIEEAAAISLATVKAYVEQGTGLTLVRFVLYSQSTYDVYRDVLTAWG